MIQFSGIVLLLGLQYHEMSLDAGAQTIRLGWVGPVSSLHGSAALTGCFLFSLFDQTECLYLSRRTYIFIIHLSYLFFIPRFRR